MNAENVESWRRRRGDRKLGHSTTALTARNAPCPLCVPPPRKLPSTTSRRPKRLSLARLPAAIAASARADRPGRVRPTPRRPFGSGSHPTLSRKTPSAFSLGRMAIVPRIGSNASRGGNSSANAEGIDMSGPFNRKSSKSVKLPAATADEKTLISQQLAVASEQLKSLSTVGDFTSDVFEQLLPELTSQIYKLLPQQQIRGSVLDFADQQVGAQPSIDAGLSDVGRFCDVSLRTDQHHRRHRPHSGADRPESGDLGGLARSSRSAGDQVRKAVRQLRRLPAGCGHSRGGCWGGHEWLEGSRWCRWSRVGEMSVFDSISTVAATATGRACLHIRAIVRRVIWWSTSADTAGNQDDLEQQRASVAERAIEQGLRLLSNTSPVQRERVARQFGALFEHLVPGLTSLLLEGARMLDSQRGMPTVETTEIHHGI